MKTEDYPTPTVDAAKFWGRDMGDDKGPPHFECVDAEVAAGLERRLAEASAIIESLNDHGSGLERMLFVKAQQAELAATQARVAELEKALRDLETQVRLMFWTSDDGKTVRDGTPEDGDAPKELCTAWAVARAILAKP